jgi:hypothetical protein
MKRIKTKNSYVWIGTPATMTIDITSLQKYRLTRAINLPDLITY